MTDRDLRRLSRADLLELLIIERQELDRLMAERSRMQKDLDALAAKLETVSSELAQAQELLNQTYSAKERQPYSGNGVYGAQPGMNGMQPNMNGMQPGMNGMQPGMNGMQPGMNGMAPNMNGRYGNGNG